jgi:hypothetical protein
MKPVCICVHKYTDYFWKYRLHHLKIDYNLTSYNLTVPDDITNIFLIYKIGNMSIYGKHIRQSDPVFLYISVTVSAQVCWESVTRITCPLGISRIQSRELDCTPRLFISSFQPVNLLKNSKTMLYAGVNGMYLQLSLGTSAVILYFSVSLMTFYRLQGLSNIEWEDSSNY